MSRKYIYLIIGISVFGCDKGSRPFTSSKSTSNVAQSAIVGEVDFFPFPEAKVDSRPLELVLCQDGPKLASTHTQGNYTYHFEILCQGDETSPFFSELLASAYKGEGDPVIHNLDYRTNDQYATRLLSAYAILSPVTNSTVLINNRPHDAMVDGIVDNWTELALSIDSSSLFPGKSMIQEVHLTYNLLSMENMGIFDQRSTIFKTYMPIERNRGLTISFEDLANGPTKYYQYVSGLNITIRTQNGSSYIIVVQDMVIKNRIDPGKIIRTLDGLNRAAVKLSHQKLLNASN